MHFLIDYRIFQIKGTVLLYCFYNLVVLRCNAAQHPDYVLYYSILYLIYLFIYFCQWDHWNTHCHRGTVEKYHSEFCYRAEWEGRDCQTVCQSCSFFIFFQCSHQLSLSSFSAWPLSSFHPYPPLCWSHSALASQQYSALMHSVSRRTVHTCNKLES